MTTIKFKNVGRGKYSWEVRVPKNMLITADFLAAEVRKQKVLMSRDIECSENTIFAGMRAVGTFEIIDPKT